MPAFCFLAPVFRITEKSVKSKLSAVKNAEKGLSGSKLVNRVP
jgi:hypothetical protein